MPIGIIAVECLLIGVQSQGVFSLDTLLVIDSACNLTSSVFAMTRTRKHLSLIFHPSLFMGRDCVHKSSDLNILARKLQKPLRALKAIFSSV